MEMKASQHLAAARDEIVKGWTKGAIEENGNVCSVGAIHRVAQQNTTSALDGFIENCSNGEQAADALKKKIREITGDEYIRIESFNDRQTTSRDDVLAAFDKAIAGLEERGE